MAEFLENRGRNLPPLGRVDEAEGDEVGEEDAPVVAEAAQQPFPIQGLAAAPDQVGDVGPVKPLAFLDVSLRPDHLLGGAELDRDAEDLGVGRVREPLLIDLGHAVARAVDDVDELVLAASLGQPVRERNFGAIPGGGERLEDPVAVAPGEEDVQVLRMPFDPRVLRQRDTRRPPGTVLPPR